MKLITMFEKSELDRLQSAVVVECWRSVMTTRSGKRKFKAAFSEKEQKTCHKIYKVFTTWHCGWSASGVPDTHKMTIKNYELAKRLCNFFGEY